MTSGPSGSLEALVGEWSTLPDVAELLDVSISKVHRLIEDHHLVQVRRSSDQVRQVPSAFIKDGEVVHHLRGTIMVLQDQGLRPEEIVEWLFTEDDSLPGRPIDQLRAGQRGEVRRRSQSLIL